MAVLRCTSRLTAAAVLAWGAFAASAGLRAVGTPLTPRVASALAGGAAVLAFSCALRSVGSIWRGPRLISFPLERAVLCPAADSDAIRRAAQLRGTMGGAGHVHRWRLLLGGAAWLAAAGVAALAWIDPYGAPAARLLLLLAIAGAAAALFPARPFYYREVNGGGVIVSPSCTPRRLGISGATSPVDSGVLGFG